MSNCIIPGERSHLSSLLDNSGVPNINTAIESYVREVYDQNKNSEKKELYNSIILEISDLIKNDPIYELMYSDWKYETQIHEILDKLYVPIKQEKSDIQHSINEEESIVINEVEYNNLFKLFNTQSETKEFIKHSQPKIIRSLYIKSSQVIYLDGKVETTSSFVKNASEVSNSIKNLRKSIISNLVSKYHTNKEYFNDNLEEFLTNDNVKQYFLNGDGKLHSHDFILATKFDDIIFDLTGGLVKKVDDDYIFKSKATIKGDWNDTTNSIQSQGNPAIELFISTIYNKKLNKYLTLSNFYNVFSTLRKTYPEKYTKFRANPTLIAEFMRNVKSDLKNHKSWNSNLISDLEVIYDNIFDENNKSSLYSLHRESKNLKSDLYTMILNLVLKTTPVTYVKTDYNEERDVFETSVIDKVDFNLNKTMFENNIVALLRRMDHSAYLKKYINQDILNKQTSIKDSLKNGLTIKNPDGGILFKIDKIANSKKGFEIKFSSKDKNFDNYRQFIADSLNLNINDVFWDTLKTQFNNNVDFQPLLNLAAGTMLSKWLYWKNTNIIDFKELVEVIKTEFDVDITKSSSISSIVQSTSDIIKPNFYSNSIAGLEMLAKTLSIIKGDDNISFSLNLSGNKLPLYRLSSLMNDDMFWLNRRQWASDIFKSNIFNPNGKISLDHETVLSTEIKNKDGVIKRIDQLNTTEGLYNQFMNQFYLDSDVAYFQPTTYADKKNIWLKKIPKVSLDNLIKNKLNIQIANTLTNSDLEKYYYLTMQEMFEGFGKQMLNDYNLFFKFYDGTNININTINDNKSLYTSLLNFMNKISEIPQNDIHMTINKIQNSEEGDPNYVFIEEIHYNSKGNYNYNLIFNLQMYLLNKRLFNDKLDKDKAMYALLLNNNKVIFKSNINKKDTWLDEFGRWIISNKNISLKNLTPENLQDFELNPKLERFFLYDNIVADHYNYAVSGLSFMHPAKYSNPKLDEIIKNGGMLSPYDITEPESRQTVAMYKRAVNAGVTMHPFFKGVPKGVSEKLNMALIQDLETVVINPHNRGGKATAHDGAMTVNGLQMILQNNSLSEIELSSVHVKPFATVELGNYPGSGILKCAGTTCNNAFIRNTLEGKQSGLKIMKLMNSKEWPAGSQLLNGSKNFFNLYYLNPNNNIVKINSITRVGDNLYNINTSLGLNTNIRINSNYDLWNALGGQYSCDKDGVFNEKSMEEIINFIDSSEHFIKTSMVHYLVNNSAFKQGIANNNSRSVFDKDLDDITGSELNTISTHGDFFGVLFNAEHTVDQSEVSESTQQLAGLTQKGISIDDANEVYDAIANLIESSLESQGLLKLSDVDKLKIYRIITRNLIKGLRKEGDSAGLSDSIVKLIEDDLKNKNTLEEMNWTLPFDDANLYNKFVSSFQSDLTKNIIKRALPGIAAVLAASHDMVTVYETDENTIVTHGDIYKNKVTVTDADIENKQISILKPGDKVSITTKEGTKDYTIVGYLPNEKAKAQGEISLSEIRNYRNSLDVKIKKLKSKGRNLRGYNNTITLNDGSIYDLYDLDVSKLSFNIGNGKLINKIFNQEGEIENLEVDFGDFVLSQILTQSINKLEGKKRSSFINYLVNYFESEPGSNKDLLYIDIKNIIEYLYQQELDTIAKGEFTTPSTIDSEGNFIQGVKVPIANLDIQQNECMLGKLWATAFGIKKSDSLSDILKDPHFFSKKLRNVFNNIYYNIEDYNFLLTSINKQNIYVRVIDEETFAKSKNEIYNFKTRTDVNGKTFLLNDEKEMICPFNESNMKVISENGEVVILLQSKDLNYLDDSNLFSYIHINNTEDTIVNEWLYNSSIINPVFKNAYSPVDKKWNLDEYKNKFNDFITIHGTKMYTSFKQSLNFVATRIPAQSMQSFMNMKVVDFVDDDSNIVYVPLEQIIYQGSDFDIDKSYMSGSSITNQGIYAAWSPFFDYSSEKSLVESHKLPFPTGVEIKKSSDGINLDEHVKNIFIKESGEVQLNISNFSKLLNYIKDNNITTFLGKTNESQLLADYINKHNMFPMSFEHKMMALKNKIYNTSLKVGNDIRNLASQTTPMEMDVFQILGSKSVVGELSKNISNNNPGARILMQYQNSIGQACIGINATGLKVLSSLLVYYNDKLKNAKINFDKQKDLEDGIKNFEKYLDQYNIKIKGFEPIPGMELEMTPFMNIDFSKFDPNTFEYLNERMDEYPNIPEDVFITISGLLSCSTDNAKELILDKINCSPQLNGIYITLLLTGIKLDQIIDFMTSPVMTLIGDKAKSNILYEEDQFNSVSTAINYWFNGPRVNNYLSGHWINYEELISNLKESEEKDSDLSEIEKETKKMEIIGEAIKQDVDINDIEYQDLDNSIDLDRKSDLIKEVLFWYDKRGPIANLEDVKVYKKNLEAIVNASKEVTILGRMLSINQGIDTKPIDYYNFVNHIENFVKARIKDKDNNKGFDFHTFINDPKYQKSSIARYESLKSSYNILDVIVTSKHFNWMLKTMERGHNALQNFTFRNEFAKRMLDDFKFTFDNGIPTSRHMSIVQTYITDLIVNNFLKSGIDNIEINNFSEYYNNDFNIEVNENKESKILNFKSYNDVMTFKKWFETDLIPYLQNTYPKNEFLQDLKLNVIPNKSNTASQSLLRLPINMNTIEKEGNQQLYSNYEKSFKDIISITTDYSDTPLGELFFMYNLIVNKNAPGKYAMTKLFSDYLNIVKNPNDTYYGKFLKYESNLENLKNMEYDKKDLDIRLLTNKKGKSPNGLSKSWKKEYNKNIIKFNSNQIKLHNFDDSLDLPFLNSVGVLYKDAAFNEIFSKILEAIKSKQLVIELKCD